jgi:hypothetical protein
MCLDHRKLSKKTRIKLFNTQPLPALSYGSENWTNKARDARRVTQTEIKYIRKTAGYSWTDYKTNTEIAKELNMAPVLDKIQEYRRNCLLRINRMPLNSLPGILRKL